MTRGKAISKRTELHFMLLHIDVQIYLAKGLVLSISVCKKKRIIASNRMLGELTSRIMWPHLIMWQHEESWRLQVQNSWSSAFIKSTSPWVCWWQSINGTCIINNNSHCSHQARFWSICTTKRSKQTWVHGLLNQFLLPKLLNVSHLITHTKHYLQAATLHCT